MELTLTPREFAIGLFEAAFHLNYRLPNIANHQDGARDLDDQARMNRWTMRRTAHLIEQTLQRAEELHIEYGLTANHRDALIAIMLTLKVHEEAFSHADYTAVNVVRWQDVLVEALRCCLYGEGPNRYRRPIDAFGRREALQYENTE